MKMPSIDPSSPTWFVPAGPTMNGTLVLKVCAGCAIRELSGVSSYTTSCYPAVNRQQDLLNDLRPLVMTVTGYQSLVAKWTEQYLKEYNLQPFILFSDVVKLVGGVPTGASGGELLAAYIEQHHLGALHQTTARKSWTANIVTAWLWEVDYKALDAYYEARDKAAAEKATGVLDTLVAAKPPTTVGRLYGSPTLSGMVISNGL